MKFFNRISVLLLLFFFTFQACVQDELTSNEIAPIEIEAFKSIDELPADDRFLDFMVSTVNTKANADLLHRAEELINKKDISAKDKSEIAQIMGFENWENYAAHLQNQQDLIKALNADYNLAAYKAEEIAEFGQQTFELALENKIVDMQEIVPGGGAGGGNPCIQACNLGLLACLAVHAGITVILNIECMFDPNPILCQAIVGIGTGLGVVACLLDHAFCVAAC